MYTSSLWCHLKKQSLKGITVAYNNSFRIIHNLSPRCSPSHMFATNYVKSFNERIRSSIFNLLCRLEKSDNILFVNYLHTFIYYRRLNIGLINCMLLIHDVCTFIQLYFFILTYLIYIFTTRHVCIFIFIYIYFSHYMYLYCSSCVYMYVLLLVCIYIILLLLLLYVIVNDIFWLYDIYEYLFRHRRTRDPMRSAIPMTM